MGLPTPDDAASPAFGFFTRLLRWNAASSDGEIGVAAAADEAPAVGCLPPFLPLAAGAAIPAAAGADDGASAAATGAGDVGVAAAAAAA